MKGILTAMDKRPRITDRFVAWKRRLQRTRLECRECEVICERVVSPQHCLDSGCSSVYVYEDDDTKMFGCLHKVFAPELDLAALRATAGRGAGGRTPTAPCGSTAVAAAAVQGHRGAGLSGRRSRRPVCSNPTFFHQPAGTPEERIRLTTNLPPEPQPQD